MVRSKLLMSAAITAGLLVGFAGVGSASAATILNFEGGGADGGEGLTNTNYVIGSFGATNGTHADDATVSTSAGTIFDIGTVTGSSAAGSPALAHYNAIQAGLAETAPLQLSFDLAINTAGVTSDGYSQLVLIGNSQAGYFQDGYGNLINGYNIDEGFALSAHAVAQGATLTGSYSAATGLGQYHFTIPVQNDRANGQHRSDVLQRTR